MKKLRNKFEKKIDAQLKRRRCNYSYESESIPYTIVSKYIPDFVIEKASGKIYIECKGYLRPDDKRKLRSVIRQHPGIDLRIVFYKEVKQYTAWADKLCIPWAIDKIPKEWFDE